MFIFNRKRQWSFDRDTILGVAFILPALVVAIYITEGKPPSTAFWVCCGVCVVCLVASKHWWAPVGATAFYAIGPLLGVAIFQKRPEAAIGAAVCAAMLGVVWWCAEAPNRRARQVFAEARYCPACNRPLRPRMLQRAIIDGQESDRHWVYRCTCSECTIFDLEGAAKRVTMQSPSTVDPAA